MSPGELFHKWMRRHSDCSAMEAWMAGYSAGCHNGFRKGHHEGLKRAARERDVLLRELIDVLARDEAALDKIHHRDGTDERADDFLLAKLLAEARRVEENESSRLGGAGSKRPDETDTAWLEEAKAGAA